MSSERQNFQFDRAKFRELVLYVAGKCPPERLGAVKFNKVLYYSDMLQYVVSGHPLTGASYRKRKHGPTTDSFLSAIRDLCNDNSLETRDVSYFGFAKKEYIALREPDMDRFNAQEISLVDGVIDFVCERHTAKGISELSHNLAWESTKPGNVIPYFTAFLMYPTEVSDVAFELAEQEGSAIEAERQHRPNALEYPLLRSLRASLPEQAP
jgi:uncharacterized phage-associated protein